MKSHEELARLRKLARAHGIQTSYSDVQGHRVVAAELTLRAMLAALGIPAGSQRECEESLLAASHHSYSRPIDDVLVAWDGVLDSIIIRGLAAVDETVLDLRVVTEDGAAIRVDVARCRTEDLTVSGPGCVRQVRIHTRLSVPIGYHLLVCTMHGVETSSLLIAAPRRCYDGGPDRDRDWGLFAPLYALRNGSDSGSGTYSDLLSLAQHTADLDGGLVGTLPLLPCYYEPNTEPSPYLPVSRLLWSEFYIDLDCIPFVEDCPAAQAILDGADLAASRAKLRELRLVDYVEVQRLQQTILSRIFPLLADSGALQSAMETFIAAHPHVPAYAAFRATRNTLKRSWREWPPPASAGDLTGTYGDVQEIRFHEFEQWLAHEQMERCVSGAAARGVGLYLDLPVGVHPDGYDTWRFRSSFAERLCSGAPPDTVFTNGQLWGSPPLHPVSIREHHYDYARAYLAHHMNSARMLRVDHVMGLHHLFCIPAGFEPSAGAYLRYRPDEWYAMLSLESHRHKTIVVGEDLGLVPREVHRAMACHGLRRMFVLYYEMDGLAEGRAPSIPANCLASLNTHDMPPFAAMWHGLDIGQQVRVGILKQHEERAAKRRRARAIKALLDILDTVCPNVAAAKSLNTVLRCTLGWLGASDARCIMVNIEDLWLETAQQNIPGVGDGYPSWRHRAAMTMEEIGRGSRLGDALRMLREAIRTTHRRVGGKQTCQTK